MKKTVLALAILVLSLLSTGVSAQGKYGADSAECIKYLSYYKEYYKQKSYKEALPNWRKAYNICPPTANQNMLIDGASLLRRLISENSKNAAYKESLIDSLMTIYDVRAQYYPKYAVTALNNKGLDMANYIKNDFERLYEGYNQIIEANGYKTKSQIFLFSLNAAIELYRDGKIDEEEVINVYERNAGLLEGVEAKTDSEKEQNEKVKTDLESLFAASKVASCDKLIEIYTPRFEADPENGELASKIVSLLGGSEDCIDNSLFLNAATTMHKTNPSSESAYFLYKLNASSGNVDLAIKYLGEAISLVNETSERSTGELYYELANFYYKTGNLVRAIENANKAVANTEAVDVKGRSYFLIGTIWGAQKCQGDEIARRSPYWVAVDYMIKAKNADPSLEAEANKLIAQYKVYFPQTADAFMYDIADGQTYNVMCSGLKATTTVRTQK